MALKKDSGNLAVRLLFKYMDVIDLEVKPEFRNELSKHVKLHKYLVKYMFTWVQMYDSEIENVYRVSYVSDFPFQLVPFSLFPFKFFFFLFIQSFIYSFIHVLRDPSIFEKVFIWFLGQSVVWSEPNISQIEAWS
jgi:hypothetical protein